MAWLGRQGKDWQRMATLDKAGADFQQSGTDLTHQQEQRNGNG